MKQFYSIPVFFFLLFLTYPSIAHSHSGLPYGGFSFEPAQFHDQMSPQEQKWMETLKSKTNTRNFITLPDSLPFKLIEFKATKKDKPVLLEWQTADEKDSDKFIIEQSRDGQEFISIGQVEAKGTSSIGTNNYIFVDKDPAQGNNYYRLIMIDKDGTFNYTTVEKIYNGAEQVVTLYPNPARKSVTVKEIREYENLSITYISGKNTD